MSSTKRLQRDYRKDDLKMLQQAQVFHDMFVEHESEFVARFPGFAPPFASEMQTAIDDADALPLDSGEAGWIWVATEELQAEMETARKALQTLFAYVGIAFDTNRTVLKAFGKSDYSQLRGNYLRMMDLLDKAHRQAEAAEYKAALIAAGFTQADIDGLQATKTTIGLLCVKQEDAKTQRVLATEKRVETYNMVWGLMEKISAASRVAFADSPAMLRTFMLYPRG